MLLVLFVLRPMAQQVTATLREPLLLTAGATAGVQEMLAPQQGNRAGRGCSCCRLFRERARRSWRQQGIFEHVSDHIRREPAQSTRLLECWIGSSEEAQ